MSHKSKSYNALAESIINGYLVMFESIDSDVIRNNTQPTNKRIMYHGSNSYDGNDIFDATNGIWTISDKSEASEYGDNVFTLEVTINNPYISSHQEKTQVLGEKKLLEKARQLGHDSIILPSDMDYYELMMYDEAMYDVIIALSADQIKIVDSNVLTESISDEMDELNLLMGDLEKEHKKESESILSKLAKENTEHEFLKELIYGEQRYKYRKYLDVLSKLVSVDSLISEQAIEQDMVDQWYEIIETKRPVIIVQGNTVADGHHKFTAYKMRGIDMVPVVQIQDLVNLYNKEKETLSGLS